MSTYIEIRRKVNTALNADDPSLAYRELVDEGIGDVSDLTEQELILLFQEFAGNTCVISRALTSEQVHFVSKIFSSGILSLEQEI